MEVGLRIPHVGPGASPEYIREFCIEADEANIDCLWAVDHLAVPQQFHSPYTLTVDRSAAPFGAGELAELLSPNFELFTTLSWVAGFTKRIGLGTAVAVLPTRNTVATARQVATLDRFTCGRVRLGVGIGWLKEEADALGMPWERRGARTDEAIGLMRALWCTDGSVFSFAGEFHALPPVDPEPRPVQRPVPILVGGHSAQALERAARLGDGWIASNLPPKEVGRRWREVRSAAERHGRDPASLTLTASAHSPNSRSLSALLGEYEVVGVDHLQITLGQPHGPDAIREIGDLATIAGRR